MTLHEIINDTTRKRWCGPSAVCTITGWPMSAVVEAMRAHPGHRVMGTFWRDLERALQAAGWERAPSDNARGAQGLTLARWLAKRRNRTEINIVSVGGRTNGHWIVVRGNKLCDSWTKQPVWIGQAPHRRKKIESVLAVRRIRATQPHAPQKRVQRSPKRQRRQAPYRAAFVDMAAGTWRPVGNWADRATVDRKQIKAAADECVTRGLMRRAFTLENEPVVVQRRRDGRFVRAGLFELYCDRIERAEDLPWASSPLDALEL